MSVLLGGRILDRAQECRRNRVVESSISFLTRGLDTYIVGLGGLHKKIGNNPCLERCRVICTSTTSTTSYLKKKVEGKHISSESKAKSYSPVDI